MNSTPLTATEITFEQVFAVAQKLRPIAQARLVARLAPKVEQLLEQVETTAAKSPQKKLLTN